MFFGSTAWRFGDELWEGEGRSVGSVHHCSEKLVTAERLDCVANLLFTWRSSVMALSCRPSWKRSPSFGTWMATNFRAISSNVRSSWFDLSGAASLTAFTGSPYFDRRGDPRPGSGASFCFPDEPDGGMLDAVSYGISKACDIYRA